MGIKAVSMRSPQFKTVHPFPARMAPSIIWNRLKATEGKKLRILDPMSGSGTTLVVARALGHQAIGFDMDPLAVMLGKVWTSNVDAHAISRVGEKVQARVRATWKKIPLSGAYPASCDEETRQFVEYWFDGQNRKQLRAYSDAILELGDSNVSRVLWCALSKMIITKQAGVSLAMDVSHSRPHRVYDTAPVNAVDKFILSVGSVIRSAAFLPGCGKPSASVKNGDARSMKLESKSVDMVITSPPYLNAIDYLRGSKFTLVWMGHSIDSIRSIRSASIGTEASFSGDLEDSEVSKIMNGMIKGNDLPNRENKMIAKYIHDMGKVVSESSRVLKKGGKAIFVIGDSTMKGNFVRNSYAIVALAKRYNLSFLSKISRPLPENKRYLPPPGKSDSGVMLRTRMRREVIITLEK